MATYNRARSFGGDTRDSAGVNADVIGVVQIESAAAVEHVASIAAIPGVDALFVGPSDLSASLGVPGQLDAPIFVDALDAVVTAARSANIAAGILTGDPDAVAALNERGFSFVAVASDSALLRRAALDATSRTDFGER